MLINRRFIRINSESFSLRHTGNELGKYSRLYYSKVNKIILSLSYRSFAKRAFLFSKEPFLKALSMKVMSLVALKLSNLIVVVIVH